MQQEQGFALTGFVVVGLVPCCQQCLAYAFHYDLRFLYLDTDTYVYAMGEIDLRQ
ncbi:hypothetical protein D3C86_2107540 [compost metagenome]